MVRHQAEIYEAHLARIYIIMQNLFLSFHVQQACISAYPAMPIQRPLEFIY